MVHVQTSRLRECMISETYFPCRLMGLSSKQCDKNIASKTDKELENGPHRSRTYLDLAIWIRGKKHKKTTTTTTTNPDPRDHPKAIKMCLKFTCGSIPYFPQWSTLSSLLRTCQHRLFVLSQNPHWGTAGAQTD